MRHVLAPDVILTVLWKTLTAWKIVESGGAARNAGRVISNQISTRNVLHAVILKDVFLVVTGKDALTVI